jgi:hypothetical protein
MRYIEPRTSKFDRAAFKIVNAGGDSFIFGMASVLIGLPSLITGIIMSITVSILFVFLALVGFAFVPVIVSYMKHTDNIGSTYDKDSRVTEALSLLGTMRGKYEEQFALPIAEKIYNHAKQGKHGSYGGCGSSFCEDRLVVLRQLARYNANADDDLNNAKEYINVMKELNA